MGAAPVDGDARRAPAARSNGRSGNRFELEGEFWALTHAGWAVHLRASRGLGYLAQLLACPGTPVAVEEIAATAGAHRADDAGARERARVAATESIAAALRRIGRAHPDAVAAKAPVLLAVLDDVGCLLGSSCR